MNKSQTRLIGVIGFRDVLALDVVGPFDAFAIASERIGSATPAYRCILLGPTADPFTAESGLRFTPDFALRDAPPTIDTAIVAGGGGIKDVAVNRQVASWFMKNHKRLRRIASVCTGVYGLAPTGLLDGRRVATHWHYAKDVAEQFPALKVDADAIYVEDGRFWSSGGVTAGIDLALALIEADYGSELALEVARIMVVYLKRDGGQAQYSALLKFQVAARNRFGGLIAWINANPERNMSVEVLAAHMCLSPRHLTRQFVKTFGLAPAHVVELLRLDEARQRLISTRGSVERIARSVGFQSPDVFRRAFERRFGAAPLAYRSRFRATGERRVTPER